MITESKELLGTKVKIILPKRYSYLFSLCFDEFKRIEEKYSRFLNTSEISKINSNLDKWISCSDELIYLLKYAILLNKKTNGFFDITLKSNLDQIGYDKNYSFKEKKINILKKIQKINFKELLEKLFKKQFEDSIENHIKINKNKVLLKKEIDFGGFGKGYAVDKVKNLLIKKKIKNFFINAGGDIYAFGKHKVVLEHPGDFNRALGIIEIKNKAIACSSPLRRKWKNYHHLINPKTKKPENSIKSIFVLSNNCINADAYATALFTSGFKNAILLYKKLNIDILVISSENKMFISKNFNVKLFN